MATWLKLLIGLAVIAAAILALVQLTRRRSVTTTNSDTLPALASNLTNLWAVSDSLQQSHINALSTQVNDKVSRADVAQMIQQALAALPPSSGSVDVEDIDLIARFNARYNQN